MNIPDENKRLRELLKYMCFGHVSHHYIYGYVLVDIDKKLEEIKEIWGDRSG